MSLPAGYQQIRQQTAGRIAWVPCVGAHKARAPFGGVREDVCFLGSEKRENLAVSAVRDEDRSDRHRSVNLGGDRTLDPRIRRGTFVAQFERYPSDGRVARIR